jgi:hypothetical protein
MSSLNQADPGFAIDNLTTAFGFVVIATLVFFFVFPMFCFRCVTNWCSKLNCCREDHNEERGDAHTYTVNV